MKITCTKDNLSKALSIVGGIANKNVNLPILGNVLIKADDQQTEIIATNLELAIVAHVRSKVDEPGSFTVPAKTLSEFVNLLSDDKIEMELKDNELLITCGKSSTKIKGTPADEFPVIPSVSDGSGFLFNAEQLKSGLGQTVSSLAKSEIRPELSGMYFGFNTSYYSGLIIAATDSYRLAEKKIKVQQGEGEFKIIVPGRTAQEIIHILSLADNEDKEQNVRILVGENQIAMHYGNIQLVSRLVEGNYPDYAQIIPKEFKTSAMFDTGKMTKEIKMASLFTTIGVNAISCIINSKEGAVKLASTSSQTGEYSSEIAAEINGDDNSIMLNHRYVLDGLNNIKSETSTLKMINADSPCLFVPTNDDTFVYIVMPIRQ
ncbi:MAG: DNA polymerase III subunit beta [Candidatus Magasanikbacteria bacterium RIFOXYD2_FULL_36_9]|uniref:Beta sliding clamp n=1 Tax=Candidatus Magasanikbacteria bacterium RIFOXYD2_FULL_36_9 TaxID=1798707 RepID=A0A1F6NYK5_9BACT|nr:MAG: DNA polymerase III subunit beta [Candidatus Magasanikbacteria bacterium RIFOXYD2_FULL_36_9]